MQSDCVHVLEPHSVLANKVREDQHIQSKASQCESSKGVFSGHSTRVARAQHIFYIPSVSIEVSPKAEGGETSVSGYN